MNDWLKKNYPILIIVTLAFLIRLFVWVKTMHQPLWWDEAEYMSKGMEIAGKLDFNTFWAPHRQIGAPLLWSVFFTLGLGEIAIRFFILIMSTLGVYFTYLIGKELFTNRIGLMAATMMAVSYLPLFYTSRILNGLTTSTLWLVVIWFFWKGYVKKESPKYLYAAVVVAVISFMIYYSIGFLFISLLVWLLATDRFRFLKNKHLYFAAGLAIILLLPMILGYIATTGTALPMLSNALDVTSDPGQQLYWGTYFSFFPLYLNSFGNIFLYIFIAALIYMIYLLFIGYDHIAIKKLTDQKRYLFLITWMVFIFIAFVWTYRTNPNGEPRFMLPIFAAIFLTVAVLLDIGYRQLEKFNKWAALGVIAIIMLFFIIPQVLYALNLTASKLTSYQEVKDAGIWIKEHSKPGDIIMSGSRPQLSYYAQRETIFASDPSNIDDQATPAKAIANFKKYSPKYFIVSIYESAPEWYNSIPQQNPGKLEPVQAYYINYQGQRMPALVIYQVLDTDITVSSNT